MKKILVPSDFSSSAKNAASYAIHLASCTQANVQLCNAINLPVEIPTVAQVSTPLFNINEIEEQALKRLKNDARKLEQVFEIDSTADVYHPKVTATIGVGAVNDVVPNFASHQNISMVVMGMSGATGLSELLMGGNSQTLVETATFPLLLIPAKVEFAAIHKIAFATDLSKEDAAVIHVLTGFAKTFNAQILIVHITGKESKVDAKCDIEDFLNNITNKINYPKIYYKCILDDNIDHGLDWLTEFGQIQMLAMVHRKHSVLHKLFKGSFTQRLKKHIQIPLLVFPAECSPKVI